jgi:hypothetical protein
MLKIEHVIFAGAAVFVGLRLSTYAQSTVFLGSAETYGVLAGTSVTNTGSSVVDGNLGVSPGATVTGFSAVDGGPGAVVGTINIDNAAAGQAQTDLALAYTQAADMTPTTSSPTLSLSDTTLTPGFYTAGSTVSVSGTVTLDGEGEANPVFIFQAGSTLGVASDSDIVLINGANADDVFWQVGSSATLLGGGTSFAGTVLAATSISVDSGVTVDGNLLAKAGTVTLIDDNIAAIPEPASSASWLAGSAVLPLLVWRFRRRLGAESMA